MQTTVSVVHNAPKYSLENKVLKDGPEHIHVKLYTDTCIFDHVPQHGLIHHVTKFVPEYVKVGPFIVM